MRALVVAVLVVGCASAPKPAAPPPAAPVTGTQPVRTEIPAAAGAATSGQLPTDVTAPMPPRPAAVESAPIGVTAPAATASPVAPHAMILGQAWYAGPACGQAGWPPRCNGPYRGTQVAIWSHAQGQWLRNSITDDDGNFRFDVDPGWYTIVLVTGYERSPYWFAKVNVPPFETLTQNLVVDFGQR